MSGKWRLDDNLGALPGEYWATGDLTRFMERASPAILRLLYRWNRDDDIVHDFYLQFYERVPGYLDSYRTRQHIPFTGYLLARLRLDFFNYRRVDRARRPLELSIDELHAHREGGTVDLAELRSSSERDEAVLRLLDEMPLSYRLPIKLFHGFLLNIEDLRVLVHKHEGPERAAAFLTDFRQRCARQSERRRRLEDRAAYLTHLIHRSGVHDTRTNQWQRWKARLQTLVERLDGVYTLTEIGRLLGASKSTVARRLERARTYIRTRGADLWNISTI